MNNKQYFSLILILGSLTALGPFSIDMYLPAFPVIAKDLNTSTEQVAISLSSFFIGISLGQLLYGPLLDRFGRKKPLCLGLLLYILASLGCVFATTLNQLIILRAVQALGSCAAAVASVAMVRDLFPVKDSAKVFALLMLVVGVSPMLAPTAGSYVTILFGWHAIFIALMALGLINLLASIFWLPEKYQPDPTISLLPAPIIKTFLSVIAEPYFYTYALTGAMAFSGLFAYVAGSPVVFMEVFKVSTEMYGWIFAILSIGLITSSQINSLLVRRFKSERIVFVALSTQLVLTLCFFAGAYLNLLNLYNTIGLLFLFLCCLGFINPNTSALSLSPFKKNAGSASALMGAIQMGVGAVASSLLSVFDTKSALPMVAVMAGSTAIAMIILLFGRLKLSKTIA
ncbi:Bcr/CflA family drug resistance efflux transporter [Pedobacter quisquiliarum]|jgi:DHA1 family bicyclomycin/chloramphenicol resistance-like MFS transporter|uniref:Bcr/CflA family drug resistance efflux transporter n=1 Tax=Pedobacter quisquiliarum TaxID=1834438 RepID=A0A916UBD8_9SPHI|nr:multidrug effflux MFS transporter [Pedobacter quisquiliarum]GGC67248.1 Bcr/CflA family drug resistance efflux transporter [Pedobacter quisquiliarum]